MDHPFQIPPSHTCFGGWRRRRWRMVADDVVAGCSSDQFTYNFKCYKHSFEPPDDRPLFLLFACLVLKYTFAKAVFKTKQQKSFLPVNDYLCKNASLAE